MLAGHYSILIEVMIVYKFIDLFNFKIGDSVRERKQFGVLKSHV